MPRWGVIYGLHPCDMRCGALRNKKRRELTGNEKKSIAQWGVAWYNTLRL